MQKLRGGKRKSHSSVDTYAKCWEEIVQSLLELLLQVNHLHRCEYGEAIHDEVPLLRCFLPATYDLLKMYCRRDDTYALFSIYCGRSR